MQKNGSNSQGIATIFVADVNGVAVANASVTIAWSGGSNITASGTTGANGKIDLFSQKVGGSSTFTATVTSISHGTMQYNSALNVETSDSINY